MEPVAQPAEGVSISYLLSTQTHRVVNLDREKAWSNFTKRGKGENKLKQSSHHKKHRFTRARLSFALALLAVLTLLLAACGGTQSAPLEVEPEAIVKDFVWSRSANRAAPGVLDTAVVSGKIYVFTAQTSGISKVDFFLDNPQHSGAPQQTEQGAPFDFAGASGDAANALDTTKLKDGVHTVTGVFSLSNGQAKTATSTFLVNNSGKWSDALLVSDAPSRLGGSPLEGRTVTGNAYIYLVPQASASKVDFYLDDPKRSGTPQGSERYAFFDFAGTASSGEAKAFDMRKLGNGAHTITAVVSTGAGQKVVSATFMVGDKAGGSAPSPLTLTLINTDTNQPVPGFDPIPNGAVLDFKVLKTRNLNIRANAAGAESVRFELDGNVRVESSVPYALAGDTGNKFEAWTPSVGVHKLTATPYSENYAKGSAGTPLTLSFTVVAGSAANVTPAPSPEYGNLEQVHVDVTRGSDRNPGTAEEPLKTLNAGFERALGNRRKNLGTRVLLYPGTYREGVDHYHDSSGPLIVIESVKPGEAVISGSEVWTDWNCSAGVCSHRWPYNWGLEETSDSNKSTLSRRREMVVVNGTNLDQTLSKSELTAGSFYVDEGADQIFVKPPSGVDLSSATVEVATRKKLFEATKLDNLVLKGLVFQHAVSIAIQIQNQQDVLLEGVKMQWNGHRSFHLSLAEDITFRDTTWTNNGGDMGAWKTRNLRWERTEDSYNNWREKRGRKGEYGGDDNKFFLAHKVTILNHKAVGNYSHGLWLDTDMEDVLIDGLHACDNSASGFKLEASVGPIKVVNSTMCNNGRGGIIVNGTHNLIFERNTVENNEDTQLYLWNGPRDFVNFETGIKYVLELENWTVKNNTIRGKGDQLMWKIAAHVEPSQRFFGTSDIDHNRYAQPDKADVFKNYGLKGLNMTFDEWRSMTSGDAGSSFGPR